MVILHEVDINMVGIKYHSFCPFETAHLWRPLSDTYLCQRGEEMKCNYFLMNTHYYRWNPWSTLVIKRKYVTHTHTHTHTQIYALLKNQPIGQGWSFQVPEWGHNRLYKMLIFTTWIHRCVTRFYIFIVDRMKALFSLSYAFQSMQCHCTV